MLRVRKEVLQFLNPLNAFSMRTICNAITSMQEAFLEQFALKEVHIGFELEFYFTTQPTEELLSAIKNIPFVADLKPELGKNQFEATTVPVKSFLEAADIIYMIRHQIHEISKHYNAEAVFEATFEEDLPPSGMQSSISLYAKHTLAPLSQNSASLMRILQNIVGNLGSAMYIACPTDNCFHRISNHNFTKKFKNSPTHATWGVENRTVAVRLAPIPNSSLGTRIEYRTPSPLANPYHLALALMSSAMCTTNFYHPQTFVDSLHASAKPLPRTYFEAVGNFSESKLLKKIQHFCKKNAV